jgi:hypothetical protein
MSAPLHLAELNIGRLRAAPHDPRVAEFMDNLALVNAIAERSPGFVWRLKDEAGGNATSFAVSDDPLVIANLSVWESAADLEHFVFNTLHRRFYEKRAAWFEIMDQPHMVFWHVAPGHEPTLEEALDRLALYRRDGASADAFGWEEVMDGARLKAQRCAATKVAAE